MVKSKSWNKSLISAFAAIDSFTTNENPFPNVSCFRIILLLLITVNVISAVRGNSESVYHTSASEEFQSVMDQFKHFPELLQRTCFTADDLTIIEAQRNFQRVLPERKLRFEPVNDAAIEKQLSFFTSLEKDTVQAIKEETRTKDLISLALANTVGGYLYGYYVPVVKYSYYGGFTSFSSANEVIRVLRKYQRVLGTQGERGVTNWKVQELDTKTFFERIERISSDDIHNATHKCPDMQGHHLIPSVEVDVDTKELLLISFRQQHNGVLAYNPRSKNASRVVLQHYTDAAKCLESQQEHLNAFNKAMSGWLSDHLGNILANETTLLYPAFEGVLRILKTVDNGENVLQKSPSDKNEKENEDADFSFLEENSDDGVDKTKTMSAVQKVSIWVGCSLAVLLAVYVVFKMRQNRKIISNNRFTHRREKGAAGRERRSGKRLPRNVSEEEEISLFDRQEADRRSEDASRKSRSKRKSSVARLLHNLQPKRWRSRSRDYQPAPVEGSDEEMEIVVASGRKSQRVYDEPQPGPSRINNRKPPERSCSCISCLEPSTEVLVAPPKVSYVLSKENTRASQGRASDFYSS